MNYYLLKEDKRIKIGMLHKNSKEILLKIDYIEKVNNLKIIEILPFYDILIDLIQEGRNIKLKDIGFLYELCSSTFLYKKNSLVYAFEEFKHAIKQEGIYKIWLKFRNYFNF